MRKLMISAFVVLFVAPRIAGATPATETVTRLKQLKRFGDAAIIQKAMELADKPCAAQPNGPERFYCDVTALEAAVSSYSAKGGMRIHALCNDPLVVGSRVTGVGIGLLNGAVFVVRVAGHGTCRLEVVGPFLR
jgi:hypothetical protein